MVCERSDRWQTRTDRGEKEEAALRYDLDRGIAGVRGDCVFSTAHYQLRAVGPFMLKNTHIHTRSHTSLPTDFISQTTCRARGVIGRPFSLLMASGEERREQEVNEQNYCHFSKRIFLPAFMRCFFFLLSH